MEQPQILFAIVFVAAILFIGMMGKADKNKENKSK